MKLVSPPTSSPTFASKRPGTVVDIPTTQKAGTEPSEALMGHPSSSMNSDNAGSVQKKEMGPKLKSVVQWTTLVRSKKKEMGPKLTSVGQWPNSSLCSLKLRNLLESSISPRVSVEKPIVPPHRWAPRLYLGNFLFSFSAHSSPTK